jgi:hypothetical protein
MEDDRWLKMTVTPGTRQVDEDVCHIWKKKIAADIPDLKYTYICLGKSG